MSAIVRLEPWHIPAIRLQPSQDGAMGLYAPAQTEDYGRWLCDGGPAWALIGNDGAVLGAAGFTQVFATQAAAWAMFSDGIAGHGRAIVAQVRQVVGMGLWPRIEAMTRAQCPGHGRFAQACGFSRVAVLRACGPSCETMELWEVVHAESA